LFSKRRERVTGRGDKDRCGGGVRRLGRREEWRME
jgi:hypothetical protein